jgi:hypothetical protein
MPGCTNIPQFYHVIFLVDNNILQEEAQQLVIKGDMHTPLDSMYSPIIYMGRLDRHESMRTCLPLLEVNLPRQGLAFVLTLLLAGLCILDEDPSALDRHP